MVQNSVARYEVTQFVEGFRLLRPPQPWMVLVCDSSYRLCHSSEVWNETGHSTYLSKKTSCFCGCAGRLHLLDCVYTILVGGYTLC